MLPCLNADNDNYLYQEKEAAQESPGGVCLSDYNGLLGAGSELAVISITVLTIAGSDLDAHQSTARYCQHCVDNLMPANWYGVRAVSASM